MESKRLIVRGDDLGVTHSANQGYRKYAENGSISAWSIMAPCPWFMDAVKVSKDHPEVDLGMHLTLMSEWEAYRWGPVLGPSRVPSLVDSNGYFFTDPMKLIQNNPVPEEVEAELKAQIERVLQAGLDLRYIDNSHGNILHMVPMINEVANKLIQEYQLQVSPFVFDPNLELISTAEPTPQAKLNAFTKWLSSPPAGPGYRFVCVHAMEDTAEQKALKLPPDIAIPFLQDMVYHNIAETDAFSSKEFLKIIEDHGYSLTRYRDLPEEEITPHLPVWPPEIITQMFTVMGASPEIIEQVVSMQ
jgi:predicted glycoside hydrolase/deacetylase ChbG (UPF0249 family)